MIWQILNAKLFTNFFRMLRLYFDNFYEMGISGDPVTAEDLPKNEVVAALAERIDIAIRSNASRPSHVIVKLSVHLEEMLNNGSVMNQQAIPKIDIPLAKIISNTTNSAAVRHGSSMQLYLVGYNYTTRSINNYSVDGVGGGEYPC